MSPQKAGTRHPLLIYRAIWERLWFPTILMGLLLGFLWWQAGVSTFPIITSADNPWVLLTAVILLGIGILAFFARFLSYVQTQPGHVLLATPLLRLNIAYPRMRSVRPVKFRQLFPPGEQSWATRQFLKPFYGRTAVVVALSNYPLSPRLLRLFLPRQFFLPQSTGFVFVVEDWMKLSAEIDSAHQEWREASRRQRQQPRQMGTTRR